MEIMYTNKTCDLIKKNTFVALYGDKINLLKYGMEFDGIIYDDEWSVRRFLNGFKLKIDVNILNLFTELEISYSLLKRKIKDLSKGQFKLILLVYSILNKKSILLLDYFDKGLSLKYKKRVINYLKTKYDGTIIAISNDLVFLNTLCSELIIFKKDKISYNGKFNDVYKTNIKLEYPEITKFIRLANKSKAKLSYTVDNKELLKDIYRSVK